jgi:hypothetical protein
MQGYEIGNIQLSNFLDHGNILSFFLSFFASQFYLFIYY